MYDKYIKRIFDVVLALICIVISLPIMFLITILIIIEGKGSIIFKQDRIGKNGKIFKMYKFRTMLWDETKNNVKITKLGDFLRRTSFDELPQFFNVLKGDMSFIGPRPWIAEYLKYFTPEQMKRCKVKPGITGWAQVNGRNNLNIFKKIDYDIYYVNNISIALDINIVFKTIKTIFIKNGSSLHYSGVNTEINDLKENFCNYYHVSKEIFEKNII